MFGLLIVALLAVQVAINWMHTREYARQTVARIEARGAELDQLLGNNLCSQAAKATADRIRF